MWTIKEAADRAGLSPDVLRAWERRYGVVRPARTPSGYRLYSDADIERLRAMQRLIDAGIRPREAAGQLGRDADAREGGVRRPDGGATRLATLGRVPVRPTPAPGSPAPDPAPSRVIAAAASLDAAVLSAYFDELSARGTFESACEDVLFPALRALGEAWAHGAVPVAGEHAVSAAALRWLGAQYQAAARDARSPQVLVALPPGARHELGALAHAVALRRGGLDVLYLGPDLPVDDLVVAVRATGARVAVVGAVVAGDTEPAERAAAAVREEASDVALAFGGPRAGALARYGTVLPVGLTAAADAVRRLLAAPSGGGA